VHAILVLESKNKHRGGTSIVEKRRLVAIVDDEKAVCRAVSRLVISAGFESETFSSGEEFLRSCRERTPDCLILDLRLPGMNGFQLQQQLATDHCRIPIILVSAHDDPGSRRQALQSGAFAFCGKPFPFNDEALLEAIHSAMKPGTLK
jgi:FixJ family two-component response regulator